MKLDSRLYVNCEMGNLKCVSCFAVLHLPFAAHACLSCTMDSK